MGKKRKQPKFRCKSEAQKRAIAANYARMAAQKKHSAPPPQQPKPQSPVTPKKEFPDKFPFWARFKPNKNRTTLVIDEEQVKRKNSDTVDDCFVHREAIHCDDDNKYVLSGDYEKTMREIEEAAAAWREEQKALRRARREAKSGTGKDCSNADGAKDA